ncbi:ABC transporter permease [Mycetocola sp. CAN_C7]|uniref:ABC transporter permease n=1 Tax=Mycetocola sp. CAN_C7 TaxID=2787724 RepID=UPI0018C993B4
MFGTYLRRELLGRRKQTVIIAIGMALAIALVIVVQAVSAGVKDAQSAVLSSVYGVGTDITVSSTPTPPEEGEPGGGPGSFEFGADDGTATEDGGSAVSQSRLSAGRGASTFDAGSLATVQGVENVAAATATLSLTNTTFDGELPDFSQGELPAEGGTPPDGGGSSFDVNSCTVLGLDPSGDSVGPLSAVTLDEGRGLDGDDEGAFVAVLDSAYATSADLAVGDTIDVGGTDFEVVGTVSSSSSDATTASNVYIPLDVAQSVAGLDDQVSTISVQAASSTDIAQVQADIESELPEATVSTQDDLASSVSGSLASASGVVSGLGFWLSLLVLLAAFLIAVLFTISGVTRRTQEFGTLKAIGWSNSRIVGQVAGESTVQALIGGAIGVVVGLGAVLALNLAGITLGASTAATTAGPMDGAPGGFGRQADAVAATTDVVLNAPFSPLVILLAAGIAIAGGLLAGAVGGWRAARLRPAEALRSVS